MLRVDEGLRTHQDSAFLSSNEAADAEAGHKPRFGQSRRCDLRAPPGR